MINKTAFKTLNANLSGDYARRKEKRVGHGHGDIGVSTAFDSFVSLILGTLISVRRTINP